MGCPVCHVAGWFGGWVGGYLGIDPPKRPGGQLFSALITANLISITVIALKSLFNVSLCKAGASTLENIGRLSLITLATGIVYSIGVNYLLNRYVFPSCEEAVCHSEVHAADKVNSHCRCQA